MRKVGFNAWAVWTKAEDGLEEAGLVLGKCLGSQLHWKKWSLGMNLSETRC